MEKITQKQFDAYEAVRLSGQTNMFDVVKVQKLSGLKKETILVIIKSYPQLKSRFFPRKVFIDKMIEEMRRGLNLHAEIFAMQTWEKKGKIKTELAIEIITYLENNIIDKKYDQRKTKT